MLARILAISCISMLSLTSCSTSKPSSQTEEGTHEEAAEMKTVIDEEVSFPSDGLTMKGTLTRPSDASSTSKKPALVLVHGSGPNSRDAVIPGQLGISFLKSVHVFKELAEHMSANDFIVLRYDKRSCGPFNKCADNGYPLPPKDITPAQFVADARAARDHLATRPDVDPNRIIYVGHSQGAALALEAMDDKWAGAIMLAGNFSPIDKVIGAQRDKLHDVMVHLGVPNAAIKTQTDPLDELVGNLAKIRAGEEHVETIGGASVGFWTESFAIAERRPELLKTNKRPLALIFGEYDWNVPVSEARLWERALAASAEPSQNTLVVLPEITHALNRIDEPDIKKVGVTDIGWHVDDEVLKVILSEAQRIAKP